MAAAGGVPFLHNEKTVAAGFSVEQPVKREAITGLKGSYLTPST